MRSLTEHHLHATSLTKLVMAGFDRGVPSVEIPLPDGSVLLLQPKVPAQLPVKGALRLCLYWITYSEVDAMLREYYPVRDSL